MFILSSRFVLPLKGYENSQEIRDELMEGSNELTGPAPYVAKYGPWGRKCEYCKIIPRYHSARSV